MKTLLVQRHAVGFVIMQVDKSTSVTFQRYNELKSNHPDIILPQPHWSGAGDYYKKVSQDQYVLKRRTQGIQTMHDVGINPVALFEQIVGCLRLREIDFMNQFFFDSTNLPDMDFLYRFKVESCAGNCVVGQIIYRTSTPDVNIPLTIDERVLSDVSYTTPKAKLTLEELAQIRELNENQAMSSFLKKKIPHTLGILKKMGAEFTGDEINQLKSSFLCPYDPAIILRDALQVAGECKNRKRILRALQDFPSFGVNRPSLFFDENFGLETHRQLQEQQRPHEQQQHQIPQGDQMGVNRDNFYAQQNANFDPQPVQAPNQGQNFAQQGQGVAPPRAPGNVYEPGQP